MSLIGSVETAAPAAFESLYQDSCARLTQQTFLLIGRRQRADHCVRRAFQLAWSNWDAVAADPSPEGWVRAAAFELALSPWRRSLVRRPGHDDGLSGPDRELLAALLRLPRAQRRALVLHDALGLSWQQTASEIEASTPAAYGRVVRARLGLARLAPALVGPDARQPGFGRRLGPLLRGTAVRGCAEPGSAGALPPNRIRLRATLRERGATVGAGLVTAAVAGGLLAGLLVGTPWHPPTAAFVTYGHRTAAAVVPSVATAAVAAAQAAGPTAPRPTADLVAAVRAAAVDPASADAETRADAPALAHAPAAAAARAVPLRVPPAAVHPVRAGVAAAPFLLGTAPRPSAGPAAPSGFCGLFTLLCPHRH